MMGDVGSSLWASSKDWAAGSISPARHRSRRKQSDRAHRWDLRRLSSKLSARLLLTGQSALISGARRLRVLRFGSFDRRGRGRGLVRGKVANGATERYEQKCQRKWPYSRLALIRTINRFTGVGGVVFTIKGSHLLILAGL
jgi:hypothetical protein